MGVMLGMLPAPFQLHTPEMEALWQLPGARLQAACLWAGDRLVELVEYLEPRGALRPPDRHLGDAGIYHVALQHSGRRAVTETHRRVIAAGHRSNSEPADLCLTNIVYLRSPDEDIVECFYFHPWLGRFIGYREQAYA